MSKRGARGQITKQPWEREYSDSDSDSPAVSATAEVLAQRKIIKPRRRLPPQPDAPAKLPFSFGSASNGSTNAFNGFASTSTASSGNGFAFLSNSTANGSANGSDNGTTSTISTANTSDNTSAINEQIRALNEQFVAAITKTVDAGGVADLTPIALKYIDFYKNIHSKPNTKASGTSGTPSLPALSDGAPKPSVSASTPFLFGKAEVKPSSTDKPVFEPASVPAPAFSFGKTATPFSFGNTSNPATSSTPAFSFGSKAAESPALAATEPSVPAPAPAPAPAAAEPSAIDVDSDSDSDSDEEIKIQGPTFSLASKPTIKNSPFSFGPKKETPKDDSDSESEVEIKGPVFSFNKPIKDNVFKLPAQTKDKVEEAKEAKDEAKEDTNVTKPFSFGLKPAPAFSFGNNVTPAPAFSFGKKEEPPAENAEKPEKPAEKADKEEPKPFSFGSTATPAFSFGAPAEAEKPAFSFGKPAAAPLFSFGASAADSKPLFSFGAKTESKTESTESKTESKPLFGASSAGFSFGAPAAAAPKSDAPAAAAPTETVEEEESTATFTPVAKMGEKVESATGEENETVLYTKRAKLMLFDAQNKDSPYINKGLGDVKILKDNGTGKARILLRADGSSRVILNTFITKTIKYETIGNGSMVRVPTINAESKLETYVLRVKTPADGADLLKAIEDLK